MEQLISKFLCFSLVDLLGMVIDFTVTYICKEYLRWQKYLSNTLGFLTAVCSNFIFNRSWTFESRNPAIGKEFATFTFVSLIGLMINSAVLWLLHQRLKVSFYYAKVVATGITVVWNFFANLCFTFNESCP